MPSSALRSLIFISMRIGVTLVLFLYWMLAVGAGAQSEHHPLAALVREGQSALDAGDFSRAVQQFEKARE